MDLRFNLNKMLNTNPVFEDSLLDSLYQSVASLSLGVVLVGLMTTYVAYRTHLQILATISMIIICVGIFRVITFLNYNSKNNNNYINNRNWTILFYIIAWTFSFLMGIFSYFTLLLSKDSGSYLLVITMVISYSITVAGRNSSKPVVPIIQIMLTTVPQIYGFLSIGSDLYFFLAVTNTLLLISSLDIVRYNYNLILETYTEKFNKEKIAQDYAYLASTDPLTGLDNRLNFTTKLESLLTHSSERNQQVAIYWIDLDNFKQINDSLGHAVGDLVLIEVARRLQNIVGEHGHVSRFGGDEFVVCRFVEDHLAVTILAESMVSALSEPIHNVDYVLDISASIGVAISDAHIKDQRTLLQNADLALYETKSRGKANYTMFTKSMIEIMTKHRDMQAELRIAMTNELLWLEYQPIIDINTEEIVSYEALLRWHHPKYGFVSPATFIPLAESIRAIDVLTAWVLEKGCKQAAQWPDHITLNVNVSPTLLKGRTLEPMIHAALINSGLSSKRLCIEITETSLIEDDVNALVVLKSLQRLGIKLSLDDFGTGYSSLSYVCQYSFNSLKIDKSFVNNMTRNAQSQAVIGAVIGLGQTLDINVVAEGVETQEQADYLREAGCKYAQGFLYGRPEKEDNLLHITRATPEDSSDSRSLRRIA